MSVPNLEQLLIQQENLIGPDIYAKTIDSSIWLKMIQQEAWPDGMGEQLRVLTFERTLAADTDTWAGITQNPVENLPDTPGTNNCVPQATQIGFAQRFRTYHLEQKAVESPSICVNDVRFGFQFKEQLRNMYDMLTQNVAYMWKRRYRAEYVRLAEHKVVAALDGNTLYEGSSAYPALAPVSALTQGILNWARMRLLRDGAGMAAAGRENGAPVFTLVTSAETSDNIIRQNANDIRYTTAKVNELYAPLGVDRSYRGFYHVIDDFPRRFDANRNEVKPYVTAASLGLPAVEKGVHYVINPNYETAPFEESIIFVKDVMRSLVPSVITSPGGNVTYEPQNYRGEFKFLNIRDRVENPDGSWGYFRGILQSGSKPIHPEWGYAIMHLRCGVDVGLLDCYNEAVTDSMDSGS
jgi:hypothetical protein